MVLRRRILNFCWWRAGGVVLSHAVCAAALKHTTRTRRSDWAFEHSGLNLCRLLSSSTYLNLNHV